MAMTKYSLFMKKIVIPIALIGNFTDEEIEDEPYYPFFIVTMTHQYYKGGDIKICKHSPVSSEKIQYDPTEDTVMN